MPHDKTQLLTLPNELLLCLVPFLAEFPATDEDGSSGPRTLADLSCLSRTCRRLHAVLHPSIYTIAVADDEYSGNGGNTQHRTWHTAHHLAAWYGNTTALSRLVALTAAPLYWRCAMPFERPDMPPHWPDNLDIPPAYLSPLGIALFCSHPLAVLRLLAAAGPMPGDSEFRVLAPTCSSGMPRLMPRNPTPDMNLNQCPPLTSLDLDPNKLFGPSLMTPLHFAKHPDILAVLLALGADPDLRWHVRGEPPVIAKLPCPRYLARLLEAGANPNATDVAGATALHWLCHRGLATQKEHTHRVLECISRLVAAGADPAAKNGKGQTPAELSRACGDKWADDVTRALAGETVVVVQKGPPRWYRRLLVRAPWVAGLNRQLT
ncbi:hypothetical protein EDC01DRAFT_331505 [Geopyxis carbonaria]|nr:hypothetical protein EDC01DRAFT_331505 [Geopyxis carbonaria]